MLTEREKQGVREREVERGNETARKAADSNAYLRYVGALTAYSNISSCSGNHVKLRIIKVITLNPQSLPDTPGSSYRVLRMELKAMLPVAPRPLSVVSSQLRVAMRRLIKCDSFRQQTQMAAKRGLLK